MTESPLNGFSYLHGIGWKEKEEYYQHSNMPPDC